MPTDRKKVLADLRAIRKERAELERRRKALNRKAAKLIPRAQDAGLKGDEIARALGMSRQATYDVLRGRY